MKTRLITLITLLAVSLPSWSANSPPVTWTLTKDNAGTVTIDSKQAPTLVAGQDQPIELKCVSVDCTQYSLQYASKDGSKQVSLSAGKSTKNAASWTLPFAAVQTVDKCESGKVMIAPKSGKAIEVKVSVPPDSTCPKEPVAEDDTPPKPDDLQTLLTTVCTDEARRHHQAYDEENNKATFVVGPTGSVYERPPEIIDEDDRIEVVVVADTKLLGRLNLLRSSDIRVLGSGNIQGADIATSDFFKSLVEGQQPPPPTCGAVTFQLADFKAGKGEITITAQTTDGGKPTATKTGSFEFNVNTLYRGALSLGPLYSTLHNPSFGLVPKGTDNIVTETDRGADRIIVAVILTPYIWGPRDPEKEHRHSILDIHRLNPMLGLVVNDVSNNAIVGLSYNLSSTVFLNAGAHFGKIKRVDPNSGLAVGSTFTGTGTTVPTQTQWKTGFFAGFSIDLAAVDKLYKSVAAK